MRKYPAVVNLPINSSVVVWVFRGWFTTGSAGKVRTRNRTYNDEIQHCPPSGSKTKMFRQKNFMDGVAKSRTHSFHFLWLFYHWSTRPRHVLWVKVSVTVGINITGFEADLRPRSLHLPGRLPPPRMRLERTPTPDLRFTFSPRVSGVFGFSARNGTLLNIQGLLRFKFHLEWMTSLMLYVPSFCVSTLQSTQFMSIPFRELMANFTNNYLHVC